MQSHMAQLKNCKPLEPGNFYHIYNRGIAKQTIFFAKRNYHHFLRLHYKYIDPIAETYCYCLLKNHFHLLLRIKDDFELPEDYLTGQKSLSLPFSHTYNAYAQAINKQENRVGGLFQSPFRRVPIKTEQQLLHTIFYIHANPEQHQIVPDFREYWMSSYKAIISENRKKSSYEKVLALFGGKAEFLEYHLKGTVDEELSFV